MPTMNDPAAIGSGRVGIGSNFAKARLILAKRAGYLPKETLINPGQAPAQWKSMSSNLARDSRAAGFQNPMMYLRTGAVNGGKIPRPTGMRPGAAANPEDALPYANSRIAQLSPMATGMPQQANPMLPPGLRLPRLPSVPGVLGGGMRGY